MLTVTPGLAHAEATPGHVAGRLEKPQAISLAGSQRMLTQRMVKAYLMLGQGIMPESAQTIMQESRDKFDRQLAVLKSFQPNPAVSNAVAALEAQWINFKPLLDPPVTKERARQLYDANEELQKTAHNVTLACDQVTGTPLGHLVNIAGRERMLSQRMAKFFFYRTWELYDAPAEMELDLSRAHFTAVLIQLQESPFLSDAVKSRVARLQQEEWPPYEAALLASRKPSAMRVQVARVAEESERVLAGTEEVVALIVQEALATSGASAP